MSDQLFILAATFARGGSKGLPGKNIRPLSGKPLLAYAIEVGKQVRGVSQRIVSTDDERIAAVARQYGAEVPFMRPSELAADDTPEILAWKHAIEQVEKKNSRPVDVLLSIPTTSPLRVAEDVQACLDLLLKSDADIVITVTETNRNPAFNMVTLDPEANARLVVALDRPVARRQDAPKVYDMTTVAYAVRGPYVKQAQRPMEGRVKAVVVPQQRAMDIDTQLDFDIAEYLMTRKEV